IKVEKLIAFPTRRGTISQQRIIPQPFYPSEEIANEDRRGSDGASSSRWRFFLPSGDWSLPLSAGLSSSGEDHAQSDPYPRRKSPATRPRFRRARRCATCLDRPEPPDELAQRGRSRTGNGIHNRMADGIRRRGSTSRLIFMPF